MRRPDSEKIRKLIVILLSAVLLATIAEALLNARLFISRAETDETPYMSLDTGTDTEVTILDMDFDSPRYIEYIHVRGHAQNDVMIRMTGVKRNSFNKAKEFDQEEYLYAGSEQMYIPVRETISSYKIKVEAEPGSYEISSITEETSPRFNGYRFAIFFLTAGLFLSLVLIKEIKKYIVPFFVIASLGFGSILIVASGARISTWDEQVHFSNIYQMATVDEDVSWSKTAWKQSKADWPKYDSGMGKDEIEKMMNDADSEHWYTSDRDYYIPGFTYLAYVPAACAMRLGHMCHLNFVHTYELAKFANLLLYTIVLAIAIHISRTRKLFITILSLMPTVLFQGSMITYDGFVYSLIVLGIVLIFNEIEDPLEPIRYSNILWAVTLIVLGAASKAIYIPFLMFLFLIPRNKFSGKKQYMLFYGVLGVVFLLVVSTFAKPAVVNTLQRNMNFGGDMRGESTGMVRQIASMVKHPIASIRLYFENIFAFDNFRNMGSELYDNYSFTNLMFLNLGKYGVAPDKWNMLLIPLLLLMFFYNDEEKPLVYTKAQRWTIGLISFVVVGLIWTAMYLSFTSVGNTRIDGVQARYYMPLLLPASYVLFSDRIRFKIKPDRVRKIALGIVVFFEMHLIYNLVILRTLL